MSEGPAFRLVRLRDLKEHEEINEDDVHRLAGVLRSQRVVEDPIWVARGSEVILNGHHRVAALRALGATWAPAWVLDYESDEIRLERWSPGPPIAKEEVVRRAREGRLFPPKTTRHVLSLSLPPHPTPLEELEEGPDARESDQRRTSARSRSPGTRAPGSG